MNPDMFLNAQPGGLLAPGSPRSPGRQTRLPMSPRGPGSPRGPLAPGTPGNRRSVLTRTDRPHPVHSTPHHRPNQSSQFSLAQLTPSTPQQPLTQSLRTNHEDRTRGPPSASLQKHGVVTPSSIAGGTANHAMASAQRGDQERREHQACWVTVFGFPECEKERTLEEFRRLGGVLREKYDGYNYAHIQYSDPELARRALDKNCQRHNGFDGRPFIIGVTECDDQGIINNDALLTRPAPSQMSQAYIYSQQDAFRDYQVQQNQDNQVELVQPTFFTKLGSFIFGT